MITELTRKQKNGIEEWKNICLEIGRSTSPLNKPKIEEIWTYFYQKLNLNPPAFVYCQSPYQAIQIINKLLGKTTVEYIYTYSYGQHDINWCGYYMYYLKYNLLSRDENFDIIEKWFELSQVSGWCYTFDTTVFVCEKPIKIFLNDIGQLHKDMGLALEFSDGYGLYMLNGVPMTKEIVMTPARQLNANILLTESNVNVRREVVRKIGIERILKDLKAQTIEKGFDHVGQPCELIMLDFGDRKRPYIKLINPSIGTYHVEGVPPTCDTLKKVFIYRNGTNKKPLIVT